MPELKNKNNNYKQGNNIFIAFLFGNAVKNNKRN